MIHRGRKVLDDSRWPRSAAATIRARSCSSRSTRRPSVAPCARCPRSKQLARPLDGGYESLLREGADPAARSADHRGGPAGAHRDRAAAARGRVHAARRGRRAADAAGPARGARRRAGSVRMSKILATSPCASSSRRCSRSGFIIGLLVMPTMLGRSSSLGPRLLGNQRSVAERAQIAVIDPTGRVVAASCATALTPRHGAAAERSARQALAARRARRRRRRPRGPKRLGARPEAHARRAAGGRRRRAARRRGCSSRTGVRASRARGDPRRTRSRRTRTRRSYGSYDLYVPPKLDDRVEIARAAGAMREAIIARARAREASIARRSTRSRPCRACAR